MTPLKTMLASTAMVALLVGFALRGGEPPPAAAAADPRFDLAWLDMNQMHKSDREPVPPAPKIPRYDDPVVPVAPPPPSMPVTVQVAAVKAAPVHRPVYNSCTRRGMKRVYYHHRYWCRR